MNKLNDLIGNTPMVELSVLNKNKNVKVFAKLEGQNPGGSVKDRAAFNMINEAIKRGELDKTKTIIEATSGNTGIALAMIALQFNIPIELVLPENSSVERSKTMRAYGAKVTQLESIEACRDYAIEKGKQDNFVVLDQFSNEDNYLAHYKTTGPEIWKDTEGKITHFVSAMGTTGTIIGTSKYLKEQSTDVQIVGCQPKEGTSISGIRRWPLEYIPKIYDDSRVDRKMDVSEDEAKEMSIRLAKEEGIFAGISSGGAAKIALDLASELSSGLIVFIICDRGDRYLSTDLYQ